MKQRELNFPGCQDATLFGRGWLPEAAPRSVIVISHDFAGLGELCPRTLHLDNGMLAPASDVSQPAAGGLS